MSRWSWVLHRIVRKIWFRAALMSLASVALAIFAAVATPYLPFELRGELGQDAVGTLLQIMASSMLAVTTFSLTAMVSAYSSATQLATPRATQLMIGDPTSQNALSTFLGAFVFSVVGIIGLQTEAYGADGRIILFAATVLMVALVVVTLLRWITHITAFGRMSDVIDRVEEAAVAAMADFAADPHLGGRPAAAIPAAAEAIRGAKTGYVAHVDVRALGKAVAAARVTVHVVALPGAMVHPHRELLRIEGACDAATRKALIAAFSIERHRSFDQDPRLGLIALSEIASRALAPATNDPGTAIEVLNALLRVFLRLPPEAPTDMAERPHVHVARTTIEDMLADAFRPILREGTGEIEVLIRLIKTLRAMHDGLPHAQVPIRELAIQVAARARDGIADEADRATFERAHRSAWQDG